MRGLFGSAYHRVSAMSAGFCEFRERLQDSSFRAPFVLSDTTRTPHPSSVITRCILGREPIPPQPCFG